jgi:hypothetical protein
MAPLQKRALYGLIFGIVWAAALILVFILKGGAAAFDEDPAFRLLIDGLWIGGLVVYLVLFQTIVRKPKQFDERDKAVMDRSAKIQWLALLLSMVGWIIGLSERFHDAGQVPIIYLFLMFIFTLLVSAIAQSVGILIGYWRLGYND